MYAAKNNNMAIMKLLTAAGARPRASHTQTHVTSQATGSKVCSFAVSY